MRPSRWRISTARSRRPPRAFSSEVDTGSREENASQQESRAPFRFHRNGKGSSGGNQLRCPLRSVMSGASPLSGFCGSRA
ncbi:hypothetical protein CK489_07860 [Bradyrhizobium sp. UFLA03-84]|nr:hypothetical protein CK489_07860 [Bradyrhizobium sp. UFLA03-84]